jgi:phosphate transport system permease protein
MQWVPFFPISERLNVFTAGCLLALMAVPTIFTLAEDALRNVPRGFKEASYALGANRLQTILRVLVPASLSGIVSAVLLGLGRVIGETMVVLLCAGNRIAIPDFTQGLGAFFQPVHTMTGIVAQEMGEVVRGSIHYRALFMVGLVLFAITLAINYGAQKLVMRYPHEHWLKKWSRPLPTAGAALSKRLCFGRFAWPRISCWRARPTSFSTLPSREAGRYSPITRRSSM